MAITNNIALEKLEVGSIAADGGVSTTFAALGRTFKDSASITQEDSEMHDFEVEEQDDPVASVLVKKGSTTIKWELIDWDVDVLETLWGGTVNAGVWHEPDVLPEVEQSVRLTPKIGKPFTYPRCKVTAKIEYTAGRTGIARIIVTAKKLKPTKAGEPAFMWG